jgi:alkyl hydroperoxide reductase subunit AhpC
MPSVQKAQDLLHDRNVTFIAVSIDGKGKYAVEPLMTVHSYTFTSLVDQTMDVARKFGVRLVPTTYIVNREGVIVGSGYGPVDFASPAFLQLLESVLAGS